MGSSKKVTVSYWYKLIAHLGLSKGPIDSLLEVRGGDRTAWVGSQETSGIINIHRPELYGGESAEGGIDGQFELMMGEPDQMPNSYLASNFGAAQSGYRGRTTIVLRGPKIGAGNPYPKPLFFKLRRILKGWDNNNVWYPERAPVGTLWTRPQAIYVAVDFSGSMNEMTPNGFTRYQNMAAALGGFFDFLDDVRERSNVRLDLMGCGWSNTSQTILRRDANSTGVQAVKTFFTGRSSVSGAETDFVYATNPTTAFYDGAPSNAQRTFIFLTDGEPSRAGYPFPLDPSDAATFCGEAAGTLFANQNVRAYAFNIDLPDTQWTQYLDNTPRDGVPVIAGDDPSALLSALYDSITGTIGMNAAHILYDSITSRRENGGMEEPVGRINDASFRAAADKLFAEGFGLCTTWRGGESAEQFQQRILNVIGGSLTQSRRDGQYYLDLLRGDYNVNDLPTLTDDDIKDWTAEPALPSETVNQIQVKWFDQETREERITTPVQALGAIENAGGVLPDVREYYEIASESLAMRVALRDLKAVATPLWRFTVSCTRKPFDLRPGTYIRLLCPKRGFADIVTVIGDIDYGNFNEDEIQLTLLQDVFGMPTSSYVDAQESLSPPTNQDPSKIVTQTIIESPYVELAAALSTTQLDALVNESGFAIVGAAQPNVGMNYTIATKAAGEEYELYGLGDWTPTALIAEAEAPWEDELPQTEFTFTAGRLLDRVVVGSWALWGNEIVRVDAIDIVAGTITLGRACADTVPEPHAAGTMIWFIGDWNGTDSREYATGEVVSAKLLNRTATAQVELASAIEMSVTMAHRQVRPYPPANVKINGMYYPTELPDGDVTFTWSHRNRKTQADQLVDWFQAGVSPELGTTYTFNFYSGGGTTPIQTETGVDSDTFVWTPPAQGDYRVEISSERAVESWQKFVHSFHVGAELWTPASLASPVKIWFNDDSPVTEVSGALSQVNDLSPNAFHATQSTLAARPTRVPAVLNGRPVFRFDGSNDYLMGPNTAPATTLISNVSDAWSFIVYKNASSVNGSKYLFAITHTSGNYARYLTVTSQSGLQTRPGIGGRSVVTPSMDSYSVMQSATAIGTNWAIVGHRINYLGRIGAVKLNGGAEETATMSNMTAANSQNVAQKRFGFGSDETQYFNGDVAELIFGTGTLTTDEVARIEGYLAWRWGLVASLPSGHPYKSAPPLVEEEEP